jgi:hypothetical protein
MPELNFFGYDKFSIRGLGAGELGHDVDFRLSPLQNLLVFPNLGSQRTVF